ncbi:MAG: 3-oxoacyl-ACP synthase [bacterium]|nr:3-oxoacyl-ACP synthase [bacterium]
MNAIISSYCKIVPNKISVGGKLFFEEASEKELPEFLSAAYKYGELNYPKFHKMDKLCKLGMLATELALRNCPDWKALDKSRIALIFSNQSSSLDSDRNHAHAISDKQNYFPSPSVFVYTLPNIIMGEIAIKHKISGENAFFISNQFDPELLFSYSTILLQTTGTEFVVCGWVNCDRTHNDAFVYCVKKSNFKEQNSGPELDHTSENIRQLYNT